MIPLFSILILASCAVVFLLSKCLFLAPYRPGWLMLLANLAYEVAERKLRCKRNVLDAILLPLLVAGFGLLAGPLLAAGMAILLAGTWVSALLVEAQCRSGISARQYAPLKGKVPVPIPRLIVTIRGPILERSQDGYELGDWPEGLAQDFEVMVLNPGPIHPQLPLLITISTSNDPIALSITGNDQGACPGPGEIVVRRFQLKAARRGTGGEVLVRVVHGDFSYQRRLRMGKITSPNTPIQSAVIHRWKHGANAAFVWRGDQDLYDPATFQSEEGLRVSLGLARRFRMPSSLMLSARLSLVQEEHRAFCNHYGWDRKTGDIPGFIRFLRDEIDKVPEQEWPTGTERPFSAEIGNHLYLHYGTHAAADASNGWKSHAGTGEGRYPWLSQYPADSFVEQRDNAVKGSQVLESTIGVKPVSYTIPSDIWDANTARAMEAAGLEVGSETDAPKSAKLLCLPAPHHPQGCERFVELTRMHPRDPENVFQLAMLKYWVGTARRSRRAFVFLAHHHLALYQGNICCNLTEELLRHVLADQEGDFYAGTLTSVGRYWRDVLSERTRCVKITLDGNRVIVANSGSRTLSFLPLELTLAGGRIHMRLVTVPAESSLVISH